MAWCFVFRLLINLIKRKPQMTEEQIKTIADGFTAMVDKCCKQSDIETCFGEEVFPSSFKNKNKHTGNRELTRKPATRKGVEMSVSKEQSLYHVKH